MYGSIGASYTRTIEPRLIALLNNDDPPEPFTTTPSLELPPLHDLNILKAGRPLLLEPDASKQTGKPTTDSQLNPKHSGLLSPVHTDRHAHKRNGPRHKSDNAPKERALGHSSPQSLRKILGDDTDPSPASSQKHGIGEAKEDFITLPQPPKKQKAAKQVVPPIISGLFEPPPQAALFPPIASSSFHDSHGRNSLNIITPKVGGSRAGLLSVTPEKSQPLETTTKGTRRRQDLRPRKKWTEEETKNLLLGVTKHGVGNWSDILEDPSFTFNDRKGADLKDRWRTCCPTELLPDSIKHKYPPTGSNTRQKVKFTSGLMSENILITEEDSFFPDLVSPPRERKSRAHRKRIEDLVQLGIRGPIQKSLRRERRLFSDEEDRAILAGFEIYGPVWTRIQRDPRFNLQSRQPTDLRDRFRNKHRDKLVIRAKTVQEKSSKSGPQKSPTAQGSGGRFKDNMLAGPSSYGLELSPTTCEMDDKKQGTKDRLASTTAPPYQSVSIRESLSIQEIISPGEGDPKALPPQNSTFTFKDNVTPFAGEQPISEASDTLPFSQPFDWNQGINAPFSNTIGEMDISRLLEPWPDLPNAGAKEKQSFTDINSIITSSAEPLHNLPSFLTMLNEVDQIDDVNEPSFA